MIVELKGKMGSVSRNFIKYGKLKKHISFLLLTMRCGIETHASIVFVFAILTIETEKIIIYIEIDV